MIRDLRLVRTIVIVLVTLALLPLIACSRPARSGSPTLTSSCVTDEMGRTPCPPSNASGRATPTEDASDGTDSNGGYGYGEYGEYDEGGGYGEYGEYAKEGLNKCWEVFQKHGFYPFKFCRRYGDFSY